MPNRKVPTSFKDYIKSSTEVKEVLQFIRSEVMDARSRRYIKKMVIFGFLVILFQAIVPITVGKIISGLTERSIRLIVIGFVSTASCMIIQKIFERHMAKAREWILSIHWSNMDRRMTELFFEKSPGQHIQESALVVSGIDKGRWNLLALQGFIFFDALPTINQIFISLALILYKSIGGGSLMTVAVCVYVIYSLYLNFHVMRVCTPIDKSTRRLNRRRTERMEKAIRVIVSSQTKREVAEMTEWFNREALKDCNFWIWFIEKATWRSFINIFLFLVVMGYGSWLIWTRVWEVGFILPLYMWSTRIIDNIWLLGATEQKINWTLPSVKNMIKALLIKPDVIDIQNPIWLCRSTPQQIVLENISHSYPAEKPIVADDEEEDPDDPDPRDEEIPHTLKKISFTIEPGEKVALLGPSGAGKTTIMRLLLRFMDPDIGSITVGGHNLRSIARDSWMQSIGYIAQHPEVFDGTVGENLKYRLCDTDRAEISDEKLWELMRRLEIDFGTRLSKGLDTRVGKHGLKLSGGQAQRLMIGAAVIGNPWFMIIDEATSSLDSTTERKVQKGLSESLSGNTSALIVAHRLSTVRNLCTKFVVLKPATEVKNGDSQVEAISSSFEELYKISPTFRELADDQGITIN